MIVREGSITGVYEFVPEPHHDERGFFARTFDVGVARAVGVDTDAFVQDSLSRSLCGVIRGLHLRRGRGESKLVRCSSGRVFDVVVDLRPSSPSYLVWESFDLRGDCQNSIYVPAGCAHGIQALTEIADVSYRIDREHDPSEDVTVVYDDPDLAIRWPLAATMMSARDSEAPRLRDVLARLG